MRLNRRCLYHLGRLSRLSPARWRFWRPRPQASQRAQAAEVCLCSAGCALEKGGKFFLFKKPGVAETIDWAKKLACTDVIHLSPGNHRRHARAILKLQDDIAKLQGSEAKRFWNSSQASLDPIQLSRATAFQLDKNPRGSGRLTRPPGANCLMETSAIRAADNPKLRANITAFSPVHLRRAGLPIARRVIDAIAAVESAGSRTNRFSYWTLARLFREPSRTPDHLCAALFVCSWRDPRYSGTYDGGDCCRSIRGVRKTAPLQGGRETCRPKPCWTVAESARTRKEDGPDALILSRQDSSRRRSLHDVLAAERLAQS